MPDLSTPARPFLLGVTGGIGAGKTRACRILAECGAEVFYADDEAKALLLRPDARAEVVAAFGGEAYAADGSLDRAFLAGRVFGDSDALARLNAIVHPRVRRAFRERAARTSAPVLVKEAAILFETGGDRELDATLVVDAPREVRIARTVARDGAARADVEARMARQMGDAERRARADWVLVNDGDPAAFDRAVADLYRRIVGSRPAPVR
jgi:dephospho-CoA kinase